MAKKDNPTCSYEYNAAATFGEHLVGKTGDKIVVYNMYTDNRIFLEPEEAITLISALKQVLKAHYGIEFQEQVVCTK